MEATIDITCLPLACSTLFTESESFKPELTHLASLATQLAPGKVGGVPVSISGALGLQAKPPDPASFLLRSWGSELWFSHLGSEPFTHWAIFLALPYPLTAFSPLESSRAKARCYILSIHD